jgi:hypothetical protein
MRIHVSINHAVRNPATRCRTMSRISTQSDFQSFYTFSLDSEEWQVQNCSTGCAKRTAKPLGPHVGGLLPGRKYVILEDLPG